MPRIPYIGPFPPPVHGQAVSTATIATLLESRGVGLRRLDTGEGTKVAGFAGRLARMTGMLRAAIYCLLPGASTAYISVGANTGMIVSALLAGLARLAGKRPILHHHTYAHVTELNKIMWLLTRLAGRSALHITICGEMSRELCSNYSGVRDTLPFSNIDCVDHDLMGIERHRTGISTLGFMSNLTTDKGVQRAIATFRLALSAKLAHRLVLAGPCKDKTALAAIEAAKEEFGEHFSYLGPVHGREKIAFFDEVDVFLFPSLYRNETQGIVNLEALAAGIPVIAYGQCCIPSDLNHPSCAVIEPLDDFVSGALGFLRKLQPRYSEARKGARERFVELAQAHQTEIDSLVHVMSRS